MNEHAQIAAVRAGAMVLEGDATDYDDLVERAGPVFLVGFTTYTGTVRAAGEWGGEAESVLYLPDTEMQSHYLYARMPRQFDAVFHLDETHAVDPLD